MRRCPRKLAAVELGGAEGLREAYLAHEVFAVEGLVPEIQVFHGRIDAARSHEVVERVVVVGREAVSVDAVAVGSLRELRMSVGEYDRVRHPQLGKDALFDEISECLAGRPLDDQGQQLVARIAVLVALPRREQRLAPLRVGVESVPCERPFHSRDFDHHVVVIGQASGVIQQVADRDLVAETGEFGQKTRDRVVVIESPLLLEHHDRHCCELFGDRSQAGRRIGLERHAVLDVGHPVGVLFQHLSILDDDDRRARCHRGCGLGEQRIDRARGCRRNARATG